MSCSRRSTLYFITVHAVCADYNHVRSWSVTRFRGMINTQPGSVPLASFKVMSFEDMEPPINYADGNNFGASYRAPAIEQ